MRRGQLAFWIENAAGHCAQRREAQNQTLDMLPVGHRNMQNLGGAVEWTGLETGTRGPTFIRARSDARDREAAGSVSLRKVAVTVGGRRIFEEPGCAQQDGGFADRRTVGRRDYFA